VDYTGFWRATARYVVKEVCLICLLNFNQAGIV